MGMRSGRLKIFIFILCLGALALSIACGGGGGSGSGSPPPSPPPPSPPLTITTATLPATLSGHAYTTTLTAINGQGALHWSISPITPTSLFVNGLSIDPGTGLLSGTANFAGTAGFIAQVTDSASPPQTTSKTFTVTAVSPLSVTPSQNITFNEFSNINFAAFFSGIQGGLAPLTFTVTGGALPPGLKLNRTTGQLFGSALATGTFVSTITIQDSLKPPEAASQQMTIIVIPPSLGVANSIPSRMLLNRPFSGSVVARGGTPPYSFALIGGSLPPGLSSIDPNTGSFSGTPTTAGGSNFNVRVTDSSVPTQASFAFFSVIVAAPMGRNDSPTTATPIGNGFFSASISPYEDPPNGPPTAGDNDYYKVVSLGGATVHVETQAKRFNQNNALDTVIQIVDGNGIQLGSCRQPGDTSLNFTSACLNDDISASPHIQDSALDLLVPGPTNTPLTFYLHVLDWRGDARPDMTYSLLVSGVANPMVIGPSSLLPAAHGLSYSQQLFAANATSAVSWSLAGGTTLPPGLALSSTGAIAGAATAVGSYTFTVQASDSASPPQTVVAQETIQVVEPISITSSPIMPDACAGKPYTFAVQTTGGQPPLVWTFGSQQWVSINLDQFTGVFSGTTFVTGMFNGTIRVVDATTNGDLQAVTLTVKQCP
jgi:hypothetical protein